MVNLPEATGIYIIVYQLGNSSTLFVGKLGREEFPPGFYFYCGSAKGGGGLRRRIERHLSDQTVKFWHIDYLKKYLDPKRIWMVPSIDLPECVFVRLLEQRHFMRHSMRGFGASDCKEKCTSHLLTANFDINLNAVWESLDKSYPGALDLSLEV